MFEPKTGMLYFHMSPSLTPSPMGLNGYGVGYLGVVGPWALGWGSTGSGGSTGCGGMGNRVVVVVEGDGDPEVVGKFFYWRLLW